MTFVPREPTQEMINAGAHSMRGHITGIDAKHVAAQVWKAMVDVLHREIPESKEKEDK